MAGSVLLVESDAPFRETLSGILRAHGFTVDAVCGAAEAIDVVSQHIPDILVSGFFMPSVNGVELIKALGGVVDMKKVPVVIIATTDDERIRDLAKAAGVNAWLPRTVPQTKLIGTLVNLLRTKRRAECETHGAKDLRCNVVVQDDDSELCANLGTHLELAGFAVTSARSEEGVIALVKGGRIDVVVSGSRIGLADEIRALRVRTPFVILLSAQANVSVEVAFYKGVEAVFTKPVDPNAVVDVIRRALQPKVSLSTREFDRYDFISSADLKWPIFGSHRAEISNIGCGGAFVELGSGNDFPEIGSTIVLTFNVRFRGACTAATWQTSV